MSERMNIADVLRFFASERQDDWPALLPLVEIAIDDSVSPPLGTGYTPFYADRGQHWNSLDTDGPVCIPAVQRLCCRPTH
jgi:hypothetical protein